MRLRGVFLALDGDESGAGGGHCVRTLRQLATAPRRRCV
jgi:hypothetical protein